VRSGPLDAVVGQMWGFTFRAAALDAVRKLGIVVINISMDDRHAYRGKRMRGEWTGTSGLIKGLDLVATAAPECCHWYHAEGCPAIYLPEASDPDIFRPVSPEKIHDVCFVGGKYGVRSDIVSRLRSEGVKIAAYGRGWPDGHLPTQDVPMLFSRSRIVLGIGTIGYTKGFFSLKMRDFDAPMSGSLYLTHHNPDLESLYEIGREIDTYKTIDECVAKVRHYIQHPGLAEGIGAAGRARALRDHTWAKRFDALFSAAVILYPPSGRN
jgi:spore maturation protein CgeB